jgi:hypothetical protein
VAPTLTNRGEAEPFERAKDFSTRDVRQFRQRRRCGRW